MRVRFKIGDTAWVVSTNEVIVGFQVVKVAINRYTGHVHCFDISGVKFEQRELFKTMQLANKEALRREREEEKE